MIFIVSPPSDVQTSLCSHHDDGEASAHESHGEIAHHMMHNVLDYPTPKDAFAAAADGDSVYFPGTKTYEAPPEGWQVTKSLEIYGNGPGDPPTSCGTTLKPNSATGTTRDVFHLVPGDHAALANVEFRDLAIQGSGAPGTAIRYLASGSSKLSDIRITRVVISSMGSEGISLIGAEQAPDAASRLTGVVITGTQIFDCGGAGLHTAHASEIEVRQSRFK